MRSACGECPKGFLVWGDSRPPTRFYIFTLTMPPVLLKAHQGLDRSVDAAYGKTNFKTEAERGLADHSGSDPYLHRKL